ncbi:MAG: alpha-amylase/4-alpha-glucanotransferase domain-containing protein [Burkholderiales bacterium]
MAKTIALLFGVHAHQPVGNFTKVLDEAHLRCYQPFLHMMERFPDFRFSIHVSGWLFDYLLQHYPDDIHLLKTLVARGQAELFGAGYTEPVLAAIPVRDRIGQINFMSTRLEQVLGERPRGAWLTERVWDSAVVPSLVACGVSYVTVDDYHFLCTGIKGSDLTGFFSTEEDGKRLDVFPISEALRYRLPFSPASEAVQYLESLAVEGKPCAAVYFDDIEKFGIWPETYDWVYTRGWLEEFIRRSLDSEIVQPMRYCDYHATAVTRGVIYLPTTSYIEMNEWTLPAEAANRFDTMVQESKSAGRYDTEKAFLRGGIWRNFMTRYPESNWMHKRMLGLSGRLAALPGSKRTGQMRDALYEAQANDAYWHGLFGGLYLPHLRRAVYAALVRLEGLLDGVLPRPARTFSDLDLDGHAEIFVQNGVLQAVVRSDGPADICELDSYRLQHNFGDTLMRQREHYHHKVNLNQSSTHSGGERLANPHERVSFKHIILPEDMVLDSTRRSLFVDRFYPSHEGEPTVLQYSTEADKGLEAMLIFECLEPGFTLRKQIALEHNALVVTYALVTAPEGRFEVMINLAMPSCDGPAGRVEVAGKVLGGFAQPIDSLACDEIILRDEILGGALTLTFGQTSTLCSEPCFSVSQSEAGFEKIMQAVALRLSWSCRQLQDPLVIRLAVDS